MKRISPFFEVILAATIWSFSGVFIKILNLPATTLSFFRMAIPIIFLFLFFLVRKENPFHGNYKLMLTASFLNAGRVFLYFVAFLYTSIGNALIALFTWPIFATILSVFLLKEKVSTRNKFILLLSFVGLVLVYLNREFTFSDKDFVGMSAMLLSSFIYALTIIIYKKESKKYSENETLFFQNLVGAFIFLPFLFLNAPTPTMTQVGIATIYAILTGLVAYVLFFSALKKMKAWIVSCLTYIEVVGGIFLGFLIFGEVLEWNVILGGLIIIFSTFLLRKNTPKKNE